MQRIILGLKREDRISNEEMWRRTGMQTVNHMACYHLLMEMHNVMKSGASETLHDCFTNVDKSDRVTRSQTSEAVKVPKKDKTNGFTYFGGKLWNSIPDEYKDLNPGSYKRAIKSWITDNIPLS